MKKPTRRYPTTRPSQDERPLPATIEVDEEGWKVRRRRRDCLMRAQAVGGAAALAMIVCENLEGHDFVANQKAAIADAIEAARAANEYLEAGGRPPRALMPLERRAARERLLRRSAEPIKARSPKSGL